MGKIEGKSFGWGFLYFREKDGKMGKIQSQKCDICWNGAVLEKEKGRFFIWRNSQKMTHSMALLINKRIRVILYFCGKEGHWKARLVEKKAILKCG